MATRIKIGTSEVVWVITKDHIPMEGVNRVGYGQMLAEAEDTVASYEQVVGRTIFMSKTLTVDDIPSNKRVKWRSFSDDGDKCYDGVVTVDALFPEDDTPFALADYAYNIDTWNMEDAGAVIVLYNANDIKRCLPGKAEYVDKHPRMRAGEFTRTAGIDPESWLPIYG